MVPACNERHQHSAYIVSAMDAAERLEELSRRFVADNRRLDEIEIQILLIRLQALVAGLEAEPTPQDPEQAVATRNEVRRIQGLARDLRKVVVGTQPQRATRQVRRIASQRATGRGASTR